MNAAMHEVTALITANTVIDPADEHARAHTRHHHSFKQGRLMNSCTKQIPQRAGGMRHNQPVFGYAGNSRKKT
jgi:hypothetical protein